MALSLEYRLLHPTTAEIQQWLNHDHCDRCEGWATGIQPWWSDPNTVQGKAQLDAIGAHLAATYHRFPGEDI